MFHHLTKFPVIVRVMKLRQYFMILVSCQGDTSWNTSKNMVKNINANSNKWWFLWLNLLSSRMPKSQGNSDVS